MIVRWILLGLAALVVFIALLNIKRVAGFWARTQEFYGEVKGEMRKVAWPTQEHVINSTVVVGVASIALVVAIGVIDRFFGWIVEQIFTT